MKPYTSREIVLREKVEQMGSSGNSMAFNGGDTLKETF